MVESVLDMLVALKSDSGSDYWVSMSSDEPDGVDGEMILNWENDRLKLKSVWRRAQTGDQKLSDEPIVVRVPKTQFLNRWVDLLSFLRNSTRHVKLASDDEAVLTDEILKLS